LNRPDKKELLCDPSRHRTILLSPDSTAVEKVNHIHGFENWRPSVDCGAQRGFDRSDHFSEKKD